ncbi:MAG: hypothetical protein H5T86_15355, partial [Armatimonadetes bacterium]|nr:hypothetical protein [Armatimonadota bacterium]
MTKRRGGSEFLRDQTADAAVSMHQALAGSMWVAVCPEPPDVVDLSERLAAALGYTLDQLRAAPLEEFLWSPQPDTFASGGSSEAVFKRKDGRLLWVALSWIDAGPNRVAIATDVTDLKLTAATAGVASDIRAAAVSAESDAEVAQRAAEALVRRGLCRGAAVFLARPESRAWRLAGISVAGRRGERGASSIPCPVEVAAAEHDPWSVSAESVAMPRSIKLPPHLAEVLNLPLESKAAVIPALGSKGIAGLIVSVPPEPILSAAAQIGEVGRALAESIAAVLQRMADRALIAAAERQRLLANQGMRAVHALRRGARGLAAARSEEAALSVVLDCIASVVAVDWAGWARKERTGSPAVLLAAWPH